MTTHVTMTYRVSSTNVYTLSRTYVCVRARVSPKSINTKMRINYSTKNTNYEFKLNKFLTKLYYLVCATMNVTLFDITVCKTYRTSTFCNLNLFQNIVQCVTVVTSSASSCRAVRQKIIGAYAIF